MSCQKCGSKRIACINGKCRNLCYTSVTVDDHEYREDGYVPDDMNVGGDDVIEIDFCMDCGQIQADWPLGNTKIERDAGTDKKEKDERRKKHEANEKFDLHEFLADL